MVAQVALRFLRRRYFQVFSTKCRQVARAGYGHFGLREICNALRQCPGAGSFASTVIYANTNPPGFCAPIRNGNLTGVVQRADAGCIETAWDGLFTLGSFPYLGALNFRSASLTHC